MFIFYFNTKLELINMEDVENKNSYWETYAKYLSPISLNLIMWLSIIPLLTLYFLKGNAWLISWIVCIVIMFVHFFISEKILKKRIKLEYVLLAEEITLYVFFFIMIVYSSSLILLFLSDFIPIISLIIEGVIVVFFICLHSFPILAIQTAIFQGSNLYKINLRLDIILPNLLQLEHKDKKGRCKSINNHFRWFEDVLFLSNTFVSRTFPNNPEIIDIKSYYEPAYLKALEGNVEDIDELNQTLKEFKKSLVKEDFRLFLMSLQRIKGKNFDEDVSLEELSKLFKVRNRLYRLYSPFIRFKTIITSIIVGIIGFLIKTALESSLGLG